MGARRYGISLRVFNSIAHEWAQRTSEMSSWTREEKFHIYKQPCIIFFYHINTIALYWQENSTLWIRIDNPRIKIVKCVSAKAQDEKMCWNTTKTMGIIFNIKNSQLLTWSSPTEEIFQVHGQNRPVASLPVVDFRSQPREILLPTPLNT